MNSHLRNKNFLAGDNKKNIFLPIIAVVFLIIIFSLSWTRNILFSIGSPLWTIKDDISSFFADNIGVLNSKEVILKKNALLEAQVNSDGENQVLFNLLKKENDDLKSILNVKNTNQNLLLTAVLTKPFLSPYDTLIIDMGASSSVSIGDKVLADGNTYIGYVSEVYRNMSKVILYSSPGEKINVLIGNNNIEEEAVGLGGGDFEVQIPKEINVVVGDSIVIPSISTNIFGTVEKIESKDSDSFENVWFKNPVNIAELKWVEVELSNKK